MYFTEQKKRILHDLEKQIYPDSIQIRSYKMKKGMIPVTSVRIWISPMG